MNLRGTLAEPLGVLARDVRAPRASGFLARVSRPAVAVLTVLLVVVASPLSGIVLTSMPPCAPARLRM